MVRKSVFLLVVVLFCAAFTILAAPAPAAASSSIPLETSSDLWFDADPDLSIFDVSRETFSGRFSPIAGRPIWVGAKAPAAWLRFTLPVEKLGPGYGTSQDKGPVIQWLLVVKPSFSIILDHVDFYVPKAGGGFDEIQSGAMVKRSASEPASRYFVFELPQGAFSGSSCYLRLSSDVDVLIDVGLETSTGFARGQGVEYILFGLLYGILAAMILYNFFLFISLKDKTYLFYVLFVVSAGLWLFFVQGHAKLLFGQRPVFDQAMLWIWAGALITWGAIFTTEFLRLREKRPFFLHSIRVLAGLGVLVSLAGLAGFDGVAFYLSHYIGIVLPILAIAACVGSLFKGFPSALYFLIGWSCLALGGLVFTLMGLKVLPVSFLTINCMPIGLTIESVFLAMALADRFKRLEAETKRLERIQSHYRELSFTDVLTGLHNKRFLLTKLADECKTAQKRGSPLSLIFLDLDDLKLINDTFGHDFGDEVLQTLAHTLRSCTREGDESCRLGGDEFVVVTPGIRATDASRVAERIRNRFILDSFRDNEKINPGISLGVAEFLPGESPESLLKRADEAMYETKRQGKNQSMTG